MGNAVRKTEEQLPLAFDANEFEGLGQENTQADDFAIPFINIAQALSPQLKRSDAAYIEGLQTNQLFNSVTGEIFEDGVTVIPVKYERKYLEFNLRENGGGLVAIHDDYDPEILKRRDDKNRSITDDGTQIVETRSFYCLAQGGNGDWYPAMISMKSTGLKKAKQWMSMAQDVKWPKKDGSKFIAPMFARKYRIGVAEESSKGNTWGNWTVQRLDDEPLTPEDALFNMAYDLYKSLDKYRVDYAAQAETGESEEEEVPHQ